MVTKIRNEDACFFYAPSALHSTHMCVFIYFDKEKTAIVARNPSSTLPPMFLWNIYPQESQQHFQSFYKGPVHKTTPAVSQVSV